MEMSDAKYKANKKYNQKAYDTTAVRFRKDKEPTLATVKAAASKSGISINAFILEAILEKLKNQGEA